MNTIKMKFNIVKVRAYVHPYEIGILTAYVHTYTPTAGFHSAVVLYIAKVTACLIATTYGNVYIYTYVHVAVSSFSARQPCLLAREMQRAAAQVGRASILVSYLYCAVAMLLGIYVHVVSTCT